MMNDKVGRPQSSEYAPYYETYIRLVPEEDVLPALAGQIDGSLAMLRGVAEQASLQRYAEGKWSLREVVGHVTDAERIFSYRALRFGRDDRKELQGFDQDPYIAAAGFDRLAWAELLEQWRLVRQTTVMLFRGFDDAAWMRRGVASGNEVSVRALAYTIAGHERHHMKIVRERYLGLA